MKLILRLAGFILILFVAVTVLPSSLPRLFGFQIYHVVSGSMEPNIPVGSLVYVRMPSGPEAIETGDVIAFYGTVEGNAVITHRVVRNDTANQEFTTKGDANAAEDLQPVSYSALLGRVEAHIPVLGSLSAIFTTLIGKIAMMAILVAGFLLWWLGSRFDRKKTEEA